MFILSNQRLAVMVRWLSITSFFAVCPAAVAQSPTALSPSPALKRLVGQALEENPGVQAARAAAEAAQARGRAADQPLYNPEIAIDAEKAEKNTASLGVNQTIDWADKRGARAGVAAQELAARRAELHAVRQRVAGTLLASLGRLQTARAVQALAQRRVTLMQRFRDLAERRSQAGDLNRVELDLAHLAATQAQLQLAQAAADIAKAEQDLAAVLGEWRQDWPPLPQNLPAIDTFDVETVLVALPELRVQRAQISAARQRVSLRSRERRADPTIGVRGGREGSDGLVGLTLSMPLFVRNNFQAEVDAANAELIQAQREGNDLYRRAQARLRSAAERYDLARGAWNVWQRTGQPSIDRQVQLLERIWRAGELSTADYLVQLKQTLDTRAEALAVRGRLWDSWFDWLVASGRVDDWLDVRVQR